jgi:hypothetical protein
VAVGVAVAVAVWVAVWVAVAVAVGVAVAVAVPVGVAVAVAVAVGVAVGVAVAVVIDVAVAVGVAVAVAVAVRIAVAVAVAVWVALAVAVAVAVSVAEAVAVAVFAAVGVGVGVGPEGPGWTATRIAFQAGLLPPPIPEQPTDPVAPAVPWGMSELMKATSLSLGLISPTASPNPVGGTSGLTLPGPRQKLANMSPVVCVVIDGTTGWGLAVQAAPLEQDAVDGLAPAVTESSGWDVFALL